MNHHIELPLLRMPIRQRLSYRQARTAVLLGLCMGLLLGLGQVTFDLFKERKRIQSNITQMLEIIQESAAQATFLQDSIQAERVLSGMFNCQAIHHAHLQTETGLSFLNKHRPEINSGFSKWLSSQLLGEDNSFTIPLNFNGQPAGKLSISVDPYTAANDFILRAGFTLLGSLLQAILLATILTVAFHRILTRPILLLGRQLAQIDPSAPTLHPITVPTDNQNDELGLLASLINQTLEAFESTLHIHKKMEIELKRTQFSVDHAADMICWIEPSGRFIYVNEAMCKAVGYSKDELLGMSGFDIHANFTMEQWKDHWNDLKTEPTKSIETFVKTKNGTILPLEVHSTLLNIDGQEIHCNFARDIRLRKTAEIAIKRANKILLTLSHGNEAMIKTTSEAELLERICQLIVQDGDYRMVWVGFATFDAQKRIIPIAQHGFDDGYLNTMIITWDDTPTGCGPSGTAFKTRQPAISRVIQTDPKFTPWRQEATRRGFASSLALPLPNGDQLPLGTLNIYSGYPDAFDKEEIQLLENLANNLAFGILKFREAEERRRAQKAILRNARLASLGVLSASMAHEINNPNNAIQFNIPLLATIWEDALPILQQVHKQSGPFYLGDMPMTEVIEVVPQLLNGIRTSSQKIQTIIGGLKHMARQDKGNLTQKINIHEPIQSALMILQNQIRESTDHCILVPASLPLSVRGNAQQLEQAFINIIQNALHSLSNRQQGIHISTSINKEKSHVEIQFRDQGCGIAPEHIEKLTNPFFSTKTESGGMGLGLSITKTILENHAGELLFVSELMHGTTVTVRLPLDTDSSCGD
ncbi:MAG: PAS domain S-box protein [Magnetococcales bacterium]|nr:PAS domain S-box protein [Magnetococcales bacterium]